MLHLERTGREREREREGRWEKKEGNIGVQGSWRQGNRRKEPEIGRERNMEGDGRENEEEISVSQEFRDDRVSIVHYLPAVEG